VSPSGAPDLPNQVSPTIIPPNTLLFEYLILLQHSSPQQKHQLRLYDAVESKDRTMRLLPIEGYGGAQKVSEYVLEMIDVSKSFPGVQALKNVSFRLRPGTVHALMGENGAGKSTLMKCLIGLYQMNSGRILINGKEVHITNPLEASKHGISMIHQELSPVKERSVAENLYIGRQPVKAGVFIDHKKLYRLAGETLRNLGIDIDPYEKMGNLTVAKMQMVEIAKAVSQDASIIVMDEPTSSLTSIEVAQLFGMIKNLRAKGVSIIYISHKMEEIFKICDDVTVFRDANGGNRQRLQYGRQ
jgi:ABC-type sugar transport system ATPase subunit